MGISSKSSVIVDEAIMKPIPLKAFIAPENLSRGVKRDGYYQDDHDQEDNDERVIFQSHFPDNSTTKKFKGSDSVKAISVRITT